MIILYIDKGNTNQTTKEVIMNLEDMQKLFELVMKHGDVKSVATYHPSKYSTISDYRVVYDGASYCFRLVDGEVWEVKIINIR